MTLIHRFRKEITGRPNSAPLKKRGRPHRITRRTAIRPNAGLNQIMPPTNEQRQAAMGHVKKSEHPAR
jgi:hypothetical protein